MDLTGAGAGTGIMVAIAALLWFLYLVPTWMPRREYLDTERTATRLQQTLRIMAETAELPAEVRVEVSAREAARQERVLRARERAEERRADALAARAAATARAEARSAPAMPRTAAAVSWSRGAAPAAHRVPAESAERARRRRRRAHRLATVLMIAATVTISIQLLLVATTGFTAGAWLVFATGAAFGITGVAVRGRVASRSGRPAIEASGRVAAPLAQQQDSPREVAERQTAASGWTPVPVPAPLYLSKPEVQPVQPAPNLSAQLRAVALEAEEALRAAHAEPEVTPIRPDAVPSRWAAMGRIETEGAATPDLDEVLRRRRAAG